MYDCFLTIYKYICAIKSYVMDKNVEREFGGLEDLLETKYIEEGAMFAAIDSFRFKSASGSGEVSKPIIERALGFIIIVRGTMDINIDHKMYHCTSTENNLIELRATYSIYEMYISNDFKGYVLSLSRAFIIGSMGFIRASGRADSFFSPDKPSCTITSQDTQVVLAILTRVERNMLRTGHRFFRETISLSVIEALLELINIVVGKRDDLNTSERSLRRDELCHTFMNLLSEHGKREHSVAFYADKMCITSQYLTKVLKKELGMSANKLIDVNLVGEATKLLRVSGISIGDIADQLNFSDQASFSKFFRKHTNQTPAKFRKMGKGRH